MRVENESLETNYILKNKPRLYNLYYDHVKTDEKQIDVFYRYGCTLRTIVVPGYKQLTDTKSSCALKRRRRTVFT